MKPSALILTLAPTLGTYAQAALAPAETPRSGASMNAAKRLDTRASSADPVQPARPSGVPMAVAARHGASMPSDRTPSDQSLSGIAMALAKRL